VTAPDFSHGINELADLINFQVGAWHDFGYEVPPTPDCKPVPPLGERSAEAIRAGHEAIEAIDQLTRQLYMLREQLVGELRRDEDIRADRVDALLAELRAGRDEATAVGVDEPQPAPVHVCPHCGAEDDDEAVISRHMAREHAAEPVSPEDAALLDAVAGALGYQTVTLDDAVGTWTGHGPGCGCPDCEGMRRDAAGGSR